MRELTFPPLVPRRGQPRGPIRRGGEVIGKKRRDGRAAAKRGNNTASSETGTQTIRYGNGTYKGELMDGEAHGRGVLLADGDKYEGEWKGGMKHGRGVYSWEDGEVYDGQWVEGEMHGRGTLKLPTGDVYKGEFVDGKWAEEKQPGTWTYQDGRIYEGELANGQMHGWGTMTWPSGQAHEGEWAKGEAHGKGTKKLPTGEVCEGIWAKGELIQRKLRSQRSQQRRLQAATKNCDHCGVDDNQYKLRVCSGCNLALYCSAACQKAARGSHQRICSIASELPSRDAVELVLKYDREKMVDLDAGLRYATKYMGNLQHLQIDIKEMASGDGFWLSIKHLSSLFRTKRGALASVVFLQNGRSHDPDISENSHEVWKDLHDLKKLQLRYLSFDEVQCLHDVIDQQRNTLTVLSLLMLDIDWSKGKTRRSVAQAVNSCKHLVKLDLTGGVLMDADLKVMLHDLPNLCILDLRRDTSNSHEFTDNTCGIIARKCPGLQELDLDEHNQLSVRGIRKIFEGCPHLREFYTTSRKLSCNDVRSLLDLAPQLLHLSLDDGIGLSTEELDEVIEATGGRTAFRLGYKKKIYDPAGDVISSKARELYEQQKSVLRNIWSRQEDPEVANVWSGMFEG